MSRMPDPGEVDSIELIIELYKRDVDRTLIRENLRKSPEERLRALEDLQRFAEEVRDAGIDKPQQ